MLQVLQNLAITMKIGYVDTASGGELTWYNISSRKKLLKDDLRKRYKDDIEGRNFRLAENVLEREKRRVIFV